MSPIPDLVVVNQRTEEPQQSTSTQQDEPLEVELLGTLKDVIESEEHPAFSVEVVIGSEGVHAARYLTGRDSQDDSDDLYDESRREPLSKKAEEVQEATILVPRVITKEVNSIHSSRGSTELEEEAEEAEVSGSEQKSAAETPPEFRKHEAVTKETVTVTIKDTFVKQETAAELYSKVLRAVVCYKREKATCEQYKIYKAQIAALANRKA